jgi:hypothetical protein
MSSETLPPSSTFIGEVTPSTLQPTTLPLGPLDGDASPDEIAKAAKKHKKHKKGKKHKKSKQNVTQTSIFDALAQLNDVLEAWFEA